MTTDDTREYLYEVDLKILVGLTCPPDQTEDLQQVLSDNVLDWFAANGNDSCNARLYVHGYSVIDHSHAETGERFPIPATWRHQTFSSGSPHATTLTDRALEVGLKAAVAEVVATAERQAILAAAEHCRWHRTRMAKHLQITATTLYAKLRQHQIAIPGH